jgi:hypothetical protein
VKAQLFTGNDQGKKLPEGMDGDIVAAIKTDTQLMKEKAEAFKVTSQESYDEANSIAEECARRIKKIDTRFQKLEDKTKEAKRVTDGLRSEFLSTMRELKEPYEILKTGLDRKAYAWRDAENKRLAAEAEEKRKAEQKKLDDAKAKAVEDAKVAGDTEGALAIELAPAVATVEVQKVDTSKGSTMRSNWKAVLFDLDLLVKAVAEGKAPIDLLSFNQSEGDAKAKAQKEAFSYPGVMAKDYGIVSHRV